MSTAKTLIGVGAVLNKFISQKSGISDSELAVLRNAAETFYRIGDNMVMRETYGDTYSLYLMAVEQTEATGKSFSFVIDGMLARTIITDKQYHHMCDIDSHVNSDEDSSELADARRKNPFSDYFGADLLHHVYTALLELSQGHTTIASLTEPNHTLTQKEGKKKTRSKERK